MYAVAVDAHAPRAFGFVGVFPMDEGPLRADGLKRRPDFRSQGPVGEGLLGSTGADGPDGG